MSSQSNVHNRKMDPQSTAIIIALIVFAVNFLLSFLVDGFLLHPIPAPEGSFDLENREFIYFDLSESSAPYSDASILDSYTVARDIKIYLVKQDKEVHLLDFRTHFVTERTALKRDIVIRPNETENYSLGWIFNRATVEISNGRMESCNVNDGEMNPNLIIALYTLIAAAATVLETLLYCKVIRKTTANPNIN